MRLMGSEKKLFIYSRNVAYFHEFWYNFAFWLILYLDAAFPAKIVEVYQVYNHKRVLIWLIIFYYASYLIFPQKKKAL